MVDIVDKVGEILLPSRNNIRSALRGIKDLVEFIPVYPQETASRQSLFSVSNDGEVWFCSSDYHQLKLSSFNLYEHGNSLLYRLFPKELSPLDFDEIGFLMVIDQEDKMISDVLEKIKRSVAFDSMNFKDVPTPLRFSAIYQNGELWETTKVFKDLPRYFLHRKGEEFVYAILPK